MAFAAAASQILSSQIHGLEASPSRQNSHGRPIIPRQASGSSTSSSNKAAKGAREAGHPSPNRSKVQSSSSHTTHASAHTAVENRAAQRDVRTLPSWIDSFEEDEEALDARPTDSLISSPSRAHSAQHHYAPTDPARRVSRDGFVDTYDDAAHGVSEKKTDTGFFGVHREPVRGRKWDHAREGDPVIMKTAAPSTSSSWLSYVRSSMYGPGITEESKRMDEEFLEQQTPGYQKPWRGDLEARADPEALSGLLHLKKQRKTFFARLQQNLLLHPLVPLVFRITVLTTSCIALGLSGSVYQLSHKYSYDQNPSTLMAIIVDTVAIPYILYFTWDEYTGKPLGLRSPKAKIRLVLLDLFFIIFESSNISLAFGALTDDNGSCQPGDTGYNNIICNRVKALCGILLVALIAWSLTFSISIFRLVERVGGREEGE